MPTDFLVQTRKFIAEYSNGSLIVHDTQAAAETPDGVLGTAVKITPITQVNVQTGVLTLDTFAFRKDVRRTNVSNAGTSMVEIPDLLTLETDFIKNGERFRILRLTACASTLEVRVLSGHPIELRLLILNDTGSNKTIQIRDENGLDACVDLSDSDRTLNDIVVPGGATAGGAYLIELATSEGQIFVVRKVSFAAVP